MSYKKLDTEVVNAIEKLLKEGRSKMSIATELKINYQLLNRAINLGGNPFSSTAYLASVDEYHSGIAEAMRASKSAPTVSSATATIAPTTTAPEYHLHLTNPLYDFATLQKTPKCDVKKFDWQEILRMYSCDEAPCPGRGLVLHDTEVLDKWCYNPNHAPTLEEARTVIKADYYCYEIFKSYSLATPEMYEFLKDE